MKSEGDNGSPFLSLLEDLKKPTSMPINYE